MNILALDTAGKSAGVAILADDRLLYESYLEVGLTHSETILPLVDSAFRMTGLKPKDIDLYAVTAGPGSFTGLRIGLAAAKGLALPKNTPCAGVSTLEALAAQHTGQGTVIAALDARRSQVYWAAFDLESYARLTPDDAQPVAQLADFVENCKKPLFFVGNGAALCYNKYGQLPGVIAAAPTTGCARGAAVGIVGARMHANGESVPPSGLLPEYHRLSQAERERAAKLAAQENQSK